MRTKRIFSFVTVPTTINYTNQFLLNLDLFLAQTTDA